MAHKQPFFPTSMSSELFVLVVGACSPQPTTPPGGRPLNMNNKYPAEKKQQRGA